MLIKQEGNVHCSFAKHEMWPWGVKRLQNISILSKIPLCFLMNVSFFLRRFFNLFNLTTELNLFVFCISPTDTVVSNTQLTSVENGLN